MNRKIVGWFVAVVVVVAVVIMVATQSRQPLTDEESKTVTVGAILPMTGPAAHIGQWQKTGIEIGLSNARKSLAPDYDLRLIVEDSKGGAKGALAAMGKLLNVDKVDIVISSLSSVSNPLIPVADENKCPLIMIAVSFPGAAERSSWAFRNHPGSEDEARSMVKFLKTRPDIKNMAVFYINDDFGRGGQVVFEEEFEKAGRRVIYSESYEKDKNDFKSEIARAVATVPDGFYVIGYVDSSAVLIRQLREAGYTGFLSCNMAMSVPKYIEFVGKGFENSFFTVSEFNVDADSPATRSFVTAYRSKGAEPNVFAAMANDGIGLLASAIKRKGVSRENIRKGLAEIEDYDGSMGMLRVDKAGNVVFPLHTAEFADGKLQIIQE